jgi:hypothetical protein
VSCDGRQIERRRAASAGKFCRPAASLDAKKTSGTADFRGFHDGTAIAWSKGTLDPAALACRHGRSIMGDTT